MFVKKTNFFTVRTSSLIVKIKQNIIELETRHVLQQPQAAAAFQAAAGMFNPAAQPPVTMQHQAPHPQQMHPGQSRFLFLPLKKT